MPRIAFLGAGRTVFAKNVLGGRILTPDVIRALCDDLFAAHGDWIPADH